ncbi:MAG TPA: glycosyltransferase family 39 protein [Rhodanobacter sp.]|nr:glycosyltransferase family 39 protein [Rhodanobacter sp.]
MRHGVAYLKRAPLAEWIWLPLWLLVASLSIFQHGPMPIFSTRTLSVAWEMWQRNSFLVPYLNGVPYTEKSPLLFWLIQLGWTVGGVSDIWPRCLAVLMGAAQLLLAAAVARRLFPDRPRTARAVPWLLMAFSYGFLFDMQIMYEVLLAIFVLAAFLALVPGPRRDKPQFLWFAFAVGFGMLAKGPVMLLHVVFPWLLGPLWNDWARQHRRRWYRHGALAVLAGFALLAAWALPAIWAGGAVYRHALLFRQTGRIVNAFAHAEPFWWYLPLLPLLVFPFTLWPRSWVAVARLSRPAEPGLRFLYAWLAPVLVVFSLISGKQPYYLLPEYAGFALLLGFACVRLLDRNDRVATSRWLGPWPLALVSVAWGGVLLALPWLVASNKVNGSWDVALATHAVPFGVVYLLLGLLLAVPRRAELYRIAFAGLTGTAAASMLFGMTVWPAFNLEPPAALLGQAQMQGRSVASLDLDGDDFHFLGRLTKPIERLHDCQALLQWTDTHPAGLIVSYPSRPSQGTLYTQRFRGVWLDIWKASTCHNVPAQCMGGSRNDFRQCDRVEAKMRQSGMPVAERES